MSNKTRKHIWSGALVMSLAIVGILAALVVLAGNPATTAAHSGGPAGSHCTGDSDTFQEIHDDATPASHPKCADDATPTPEPDNQAPMAIGSLSDVSLRVRQSTDPIDVSVAFEDPDADDTLTFSAASDNTAVANASIAGSQMTVVAGDTRGSARITVTADDGNGGMASTSFAVTVAENYTLMADPYGDPMLPDSEDPDKYALMRDIPHHAVYLAGGEFDAHFSLGVAGSADDVTVTITVREMNDIAISDSDGLIGASFKDAETDLEGSLTVKSTDQGSRAFEIEGMCEASGGWALIEVKDKDLDLVAKGAIYCPLPPDPEPGPDRTDVSDAFTVASYGDWEYHKVTDGYVLEVPEAEGNVHMVNDHYNETGLLSRDEPVMHDMYTLGVSNTEMLDNMANGSPRRPMDDPNNLLTRQQKNADVEEGQRTIEVLVGQPNVQLTVTTRMAGPAYIRFLNSDMMPFGTDVDEEPMWRGADVVGLDSQGRLTLNNVMELSAAKALAYDQYNIVTPGVVPGLRPNNSRLVGAAGTYNQGAFRFFNPCPSEGHHFYVEVYEASGKYLQTTEKIECVVQSVGPTGLDLKIDSDLPGEGVLNFRPSQNSVSHTVLVIDATDPDDGGPKVANRNIVYEVDVEHAVRPFTTVAFNAREGRELNSGWTYHIVVIAEGLDGRHQASVLRNYSVEWIGEDIVAPSTDDPNTGDGHDLCEVDNAEITVLLSNCDTNTAPMAVGSIAAQTVMAGMMSEMDVSGYFRDADMGDTLTYTAMSNMRSYATVSTSGSMVTIMGVAMGSATITVTATDMHGATAMQAIMVTVTAAELGAPTNVMARVDDSDPAVTNVVVTWMDGDNSDAHWVGLYDVLNNRTYGSQRIAGDPSAMTYTFTDVDPGTYLPAVISTPKAGDDSRPMVDYARQSNGMPMLTVVSGQ